MIDNGEPFIMFTSKAIEIYPFGFGPTTNLVIRAPSGKDIVLSLSQQQMDSIHFRTARQFFKRCREERLLSLIDEAKNGRALEEIVRHYDIADVCNFSDINIYGLRRMLKVIVHALYRYPRLRSKLCFLGTHHTYEDIVQRLMRGDVEMLHAFGLEYICSSQNARELGNFLHELFYPLILDDTSYIATAISALGFFDAILFDRNDFDGLSYVRIISDLRRSAQCGFHPQGCHSPESVVYHEIGHMIDYLCNFSHSPEYSAHMDRFSPREISANLSEYAQTSPEEAVAEGFAEYMCNPSPRPMARWIGEELDRFYRRL